jgi:hypothetical protein
MTERKNWMWQGYIIFLFLLILDDTYAFISPHSNKARFLLVLEAYHPFLAHVHIVNFCQVFINILCFLPVVFYTYQIYFFSAHLWTLLLILRIILEICGHPYEILHLKAVSQAAPRSALIFLFSSVSLYLPSYAAHINYIRRIGKLKSG